MEEIKELEEWLENHQGAEIKSGKDGTMKRIGEPNEAWKKIQRWKELKKIDRLILKKQSVSLLLRDYNKIVIQ